MYYVEDFFLILLSYREDIKTFQKISFETRVN